jgi:hypothetical protein
MTVRVPEGMSSVDAFNALYIRANALGKGWLNPCSGQNPSSPWNAIQIFKSYCHNGYCDYVRGKLMKVNYRTFPELNVKNYDKEYGQGAAQKAIDAYQKTMSQSDPKEKYDLDCEPCAYFTSYWKQKTPEDDRKDMDEKFRKCEMLEESERKAEEQVLDTHSRIILNQCKVRYALVSRPGNHVGHDYKSCQRALDHFKILLEDRSFEETTVKGLSVCRYNRVLPFLEKCNEQSNEVSLNTAKNILEAHIPKE